MYVKRIDLKTLWYQFPFNFEKKKKDESCFMFPVWNIGYLDDEAINAVVDLVRYIE